MVREYSIINKIAMFLCFLIITSCKENDIKKSNLDIPKLDFSDQVNLEIKEKYFTTQIDSIDRYINSIPYRIDINSNQLYRYWVRSYNDMIEIRFFNRDVFEKSESDYLWGKKGYNYLFGIKGDRAFYIRWRNEIKRDSAMTGMGPRITSDIGKYTVKIETNLPKDEITSNFKDINCPIDIIEVAKVRIKNVDIGRIISSNYQPFVE
jgi:hypothetical protein